MMNNCITKSCLAGLLYLLISIWPTAQAQDPTTILTSATILMGFNLQKVSGDSQMVCTDSTLADSLVVQVQNKAGNGIPGATVQFAVASKPGTSEGSFSATTVTTDDSGRAGVTYTAGHTSGNYLISATATDPEVRFLNPQIFKVIAVGVRLIAEDSRPGSNEPLTECMENREVTFTAGASSNFPLSATEPITFTLHIDKPDGTEEVLTEVSFARRHAFTIPMFPVPQTNVNHFYTTNVYVTARDAGGRFTCRSDSFDIDVYKLWIDYLRHEDTDKQWKAVVGEGIEYKAIASKNCTDWRWHFPDDNSEWSKVWTSTGGDARSTENPDNGQMLRIGMSNLRSSGGTLRPANSWFGDTYGTVEVSCKDGDGNEHIFRSTQMTPSKKVEVFFPKSVNVNGGAGTRQNPPLWFLLWRDGGVVDQLSNTTFNEVWDYGAWTPAAGLELGPLAATQNGPTDVLLDLNGQPFQITGNGVHLDCLGETIGHEFHHQDIFFMQPGAGGPGPTRPGHSDNDGIPDASEDNPAQPFFPVSLTGNNDSFNFNYPPGGGFDYSDNEVRCRILELQPQALPLTHPERDWSKAIENPNWRQD